MTKARVGRRPDGPEDANPMNRRLPAEVVSRRKGNEQRVGPGKAAKEESAPSNVQTDLKQVLAMKPDARVKWLARAVQQAHPQDGRLAPKTIYDIIAHAKFANDVSEKAGQRMYRVVHANLSLFSTRQQKFLEKECALAKQFAASAFSAAQAEDEDKAAATMEDMMARCRAFVRERQSERGERNAEGGEDGEQEAGGAEPAEPPATLAAAEPLEQVEPLAELDQVSGSLAEGVPAREASRSRSDAPAEDASLPTAPNPVQKEKSPVKVKGTISEKIAEAARVEDAKEQERDTKDKKDKAKSKVKNKADKNGNKDKDAGGNEKAKTKTKAKEKKEKADRKKHGRHSTASSSCSGRHSDKDRSRSRSRSRGHRRDAKRGGKVKGRSHNSSESSSRGDRDASGSRHRSAKKSGKAKGKSHHSSGSSGRKRRRSVSSSKSHGKRRR